MHYFCLNYFINDILIFCTLILFKFGCTMHLNKNIVIYTNPTKSVRTIN